MSEHLDNPTPAHSRPGPDELKAHEQQGAMIARALEIRRHRRGVLLDVRHGGGPLQVRAEQAVEKQRPPGREQLRLQGHGLLVGRIVGRGSGGTEDADGRADVVQGLHDFHEFSQYPEQAPGLTQFQVIDYKLLFHFAPHSGKRQLNRLP